MNKNIKEIQKHINLKTDYESDKSNLDSMAKFTVETIEAMQAVIKHNLDIKRKYDKKEVKTIIKIMLYIKEDEEKEIYKRLEELEKEIKRNFF